MSVRRWRWDKKAEKLVEVDMSGEKPRARKPIWCFDPYKSPVTGEIIRGNRQREKDLTQHGCIDARDAHTPEQGRKIRDAEHDQSFKEHTNELARELYRQ